MNVILVIEGPNLGEGIKKEARISVLEPGVYAAVQLRDDAPPPVSPRRRRGLLATMRRRRHEELVHSRRLGKAPLD